MKTPYDVDSGSTYFHSSVVVIFVCASIAAEIISEIPT